MPGRKDQRNRELKRTEQSCTKLTDIFKKSKSSEESKVLSASENQDFATSNMESEFSYLINFFYDGKILSIHYQLYFINYIIKHIVNNFISVMENKYVSL